MTIRIRETNLTTETQVSSQSRYRNQKIIYYGEQNFITFDTYLRKPYVPTGRERVISITPGLQYRPDLLAYDVYGTQNLWWKIMEANKIYDIFDFVTGKTIMLPDDVY